MDRVPGAGELYKDTAGRVYQVVAVAVHAQTGEQMAVYQAMYGEFGIYVMPLARFMGEADAGQSFGALRQHLFERLEKPAIAAQAQDLKETGEPADAKDGLQRAQGRQGGEFVLALKARADAEAAALAPRLQPRTQSPAEAKRVLRRYETETAKEAGYDYEKRRRQMEEREQRREMFRKTERHESASEELRANPCLMKFLEAETYEEKSRVLHEIQEDMTDRLIDDIAVVLDVVIPEGELQDRFRQLQNIILTRQKYEINRFR